MGARERLIAEREARGLTHEDLAELAGGIVTAEDVRRIEAGLTSPDLKTMIAALRAWSAAWGIRVPELGRKEVGLSPDHDEGSDKPRVLHIRISATMKDALDALADELGVTRSELVRTALVNIMLQRRRG